MGPAVPLLVGGTLLANYLGARSKESLRKRQIAELMAMLDPSKLGAEANTIFDMLRASPMYSGLRNRAMVGASTLSNQLQNSFAMRGLNTSGLAAATLPMARSSFQSSFNDIDMGLFQDALKTAMANIQQRIAIKSGSQPISPMGTAFGNTLEASLPMIYSWLSKRYGLPQMSAGYRSGMNELTMNSGSAPYGR